MTVNPHEKVQVGHYYMLKRKYQEALRWYDEAYEELPPAQPPGITEVFESMVGPRNFAFFHYYCLTKLGRTDKAAEKLAEFERMFLPTLPSETETETATTQRTANQPMRALLDPSSDWPRLLRNLYIAEVFLSLDAATDGARYFASAIESAPSDEAHLADATMLTQLLLLQQEQVEFASFATRTLVPSLLSQVDFEKYGEGSAANDAEQLLSHIYVMAILPMFAPEFIDGLPRDTVTALLPDWIKLRTQARHDADRLGCDLFLREAYRQLGNEQELAATHARIARNLAAKRLLPEGGVSEFFGELREESRSAGP